MIAKYVPFFLLFFFNSCVQPSFKFETNKEGEPILKPELIQSKSVVHTGLFNQERTLGKVMSWKELKL